MFPAGLFFHTSYFECHLPPEVGKVCDETTGKPCFRGPRLTLGAVGLPSSQSVAAQTSIAAEVWATSHDCTLHRRLGTHTGLE
jgi:hypothetical protein